MNEEQRAELCKAHGITVSMLDVLEAAPAQLVYQPGAYTTWRCHGREVTIDVNQLIQHRLAERGEPDDAGFRYLDPTAAGLALLAELDATTALTRKD